MRGVQLSLLGHEDPSVLEGFAGLRRDQLDAESWIDYAAGFVRGHAALFDTLREKLPWQHERRMMYEREVDVPRLYASITLGGEWSEPVLEEIARLLSQRYRASFEKVGAQLYRDGQDSVAFHRDHMPRNTHTLVAIVSLGTPRRFMVRPFGGGTSRAYRLGWGDLFVMGGLCQTNWEHGIPKQPHAEPRMSLVYRHVY